MNYGWPNVSWIRWRYDCYLSFFLSVSFKFNTICCIFFAYSISNIHVSDPSFVAIYWDMHTTSNSSTRIKNYLECLMKWFSKRRTYLRLTHRIETKHILLKKPILIWALKLHVQWMTGKRDIDALCSQCKLSLKWWQKYLNPAIVYMFTRSIFKYLIVIIQLMSTI